MNARFSKEFWRIPLQSEGLGNTSYLAGRALADTLLAAITEFSARYAEQNNRDYQAYQAEILAGRLDVSRGD